MDTHARSIAKAVSYRLAGSATTGFLVFVFGGHSLALSAGAGAADMVLKIALYFMHERLWNNIEYGRAKRYSAGE
jgi:adenylylsulfate kinase